jgi:general secretion pathway protein G
MKNQKKPMLIKKAFSLVEMVVVLLIIGILATFVSLEVIDYLGEAKVTKAKADIEKVSQAIDEYRLRNDQYPETLEDLLGGENEEGEEMKKYFKGNSIPKDPWGRDYEYIPDTDNKYDLISYGKDGEDGGEGLDADITNFDSEEDEE